MKNNNANKYICIEETEVIEMKETLQEAEVEEMKKRVLVLMLAVWCVFATGCSFLGGGADADL